MKTLTLALVCLLSAGDPALSQQTAAQTDKPVTPTTVSQPAAAPVPNTLLDGTPIKLRLTETISSKSATTGQQIPFEVAEEVDVQGQPVILKGAPALANVTTAHSKRGLGRGGKLDINVDSTRLVDGERVQLRGVRDNQGGGHVAVMTTAIVATTILFFPAAPLFLFVHGKDVTIPKGTEVTAFVQGDMKLDMAKMVEPGAPSASVAGVAQMASLSVESSSPGADIEVDGAFVGSTPSTVLVTPGQHTILVKKKGYADWSRAMNVSGTGVRLNAELEVKP